MRNTIIITLFAAIFLTVSAIPWPVGVTPGGQDSSWTIMTSYGNYHGGSGGWEGCTNPAEYANFHFGVDIEDYPNFAPSDTVRCVRDGYVRQIDSVLIAGTDYQYFLVICDSMSSTDGWCYQHMDTPNFSETDVVYLSDSLAVMDPLVEPQAHLHFMRSDSVYSSTHPGLLNPLDSLIPPASSDSGFTWEFHTDEDTLFFLEEMIHWNWPQNSGNPSDVWQYQVQPDNIHDAVDLFYAYWLTGDGNKPLPVNADPLNPHKIEWTLFRLLQSDTVDVFTRYVVEFTGAIGAVSDTTKYRQFYFRWPLRQYLFTGNPGLISCLTNCGDATGLD